MGFPAIDPPGIPWVALICEHSGSAGDSALHDQGWMLTNIFRIQLLVSVGLSIGALYTMCDLHIKYHAILLCRT
ncbi:hypothetical protein BDW62DRAFT_202964 [Aspergillus aurantiobrunneus]